MDQIDLHTKSSDEQPLQQSIVSLYRKLLKLSDLNEDSCFYQNGGTSLSATLLLAELLSQHGIKVSFDEFQKHSTPSALAAKLSKRPLGTELPRLERHTSYERSEFALSGAQSSRCWYLDGFRGEKAGDDGMYNSGYATWLMGRVDFDCLERAFNLAASQHDAFAMAYTASKGRVTQTYKGHRPVEFLVEAAPGPIRDAYLARDAAQGAYIGDLPVVSEFVHAPFDWANAENIRCRIYKVDEAACLLLLAGNHVAFDFMSRGVFLRNLTAIYNGLIDGQSRSTRRPVQYRDYLEWEQRYLESAAYSQNLSFWIKYLSGSEQDVRLPTITSRSQTRSEDALYRQDKSYLKLGVELTARVKERAKASNVTPYVLLLTAFAMTLAKHSGKIRMTIGTQIANRRQSEVLEVCGCFAQPVALVCNLRVEETVDEAFRSVQRDLSAAIEHQPVSLPAIADALQREGGKRFHPLYQCNFEYFDAKPEPLALLGVQTQELFIPYHFGRTSSELMFLLWDRDDGISGVILYARELHTPAMIDAIAATYVDVLRMLLETPAVTMGELIPEVHV